jgi:hypothetical protein
MDEPRRSGNLPLLELAFSLAELVFYLVAGAVACAGGLITAWPALPASLPIVLLLLAGLILQSVPLALMAVAGFVVWLTRDRPEPPQTISSPSSPLWDRELDV